MNSSFYRSHATHTRIVDTLNEALRAVENGDISSRQATEVLYTALSNKCSFTDAQVSLGYVKADMPTKFLEDCAAEVLSRKTPMALELLKTDEEAQNALVDEVLNLAIESHTIPHHVDKSVVEVVRRILCLPKKAQES